MVSWCVLKRAVSPAPQMNGLFGADGRSGHDRPSLHVPLFDRCPLLESKRGNLGIVAGSPPRVVAGLRGGD